MSRLLLLNKYLLNTYDVPCAYDETDLESSEKIFSVFNYLIQWEG